MNYILSFLQENIEAETSKGSQQIIEQIDSLKQKLSKSIEEAQKTELGRKGLEAAEGISKQAKKAAEQIEQISKSEAFQTVSKVLFFVFKYLFIHFKFLFYRLSKQLKRRLVRPLYRQHNCIEHQQN